MLALNKKPGYSDFLENSKKMDGGARPPAFLPPGGAFRSFTIKLF